MENFWAMRGSLSVTRMIQLTELVTLRDESRSVRAEGKLMFVLHAP